jgi:hypothetical protein
MGEAKNKGTFEQRKAAAIGRQKQIPVTDKDLTPFNCEWCGNNLFLELKQLKKLSALSPKNPTGQDQLIMINVFKCTNCEWVCDGMGNPLVKGAEEVSADA